MAFQVNFDSIEKSCMQIGNCFYFILSGESEENIRALFDKAIVSCR